MSRLLNSCGDGSQRGLRAHTTIDRSKPVLAVATQDGKDTTREPLLSFLIGYQDSISRPFPATFTCLRTAGAPDGPVTFCAAGADSSLPDRPTSSNQTGSARPARRSPSRPPRATRSPG